MRRTLFALLIPLLLWAAGAAGPAEAKPTPQAADALAIGQDCNSREEGRARVAFYWTPSGAGRQWLDLSRANNGFLPGTFAAAGPFDATKKVLTWDGLEPNAAHYFRINTLAPDGSWHPSDTFSFRTDPCGDPNAVAPNPDLLALRDRLEAEIAASGINVAVAVTDLQTGETIDVRGDEPRLSGCTINFFVLMRVVMDLQQGRYPQALVDSLIAQTIYGSNPVTARELLRIMRGGDIGAAMLEVNDLLRLTAAQASVYDHPPAYPQESLWGYANVLTANDMNRALRALWSGGILSPDWRDYFLNKLTGVKPGLQYLIPAGVGAASVSHKNGFFADAGGWVDNDAGIVTFQRGGNVYGYAISFFSQNVPYKYADIPIGQTVSRLAWEYFSGRYQ